MELQTQKKAIPSRGRGVQSGCFERGFVDRYGRCGVTNIMVNLRNVWILQLMPSWNHSELSAVRSRWNAAVGEMNVTWTSGRQSADTAQ